MLCQGHALGQIQARDSETSQRKELARVALARLRALRANWPSLDCVRALRATCCVLRAVCCTGVVFNVISGMHEAGSQRNMNKAFSFLKKEILRFYYSLMPLE
jgi:hypothetical protein